MSPGVKWIFQASRWSKTTAWSCLWTAAWGSSSCWSPWLPVPESPSPTSVSAPWRIPASGSRFPSDTWVPGLVTWPLPPWLLPPTCSLKLEPSLSTDKSTNGDLYCKWNSLSRKIRRGVNGIFSIYLVVYFWYYGLLYCFLFCLLLLVNQHVFVISVMGWMQRPGIQNQGDSLVSGHTVLRRACSASASRGLHCVVDWIG